MKNFEAAGLLPFVDARLADAHELVPRLEGPFDFTNLPYLETTIVNGQLAISYKRQGR